MSKKNVKFVEIILSENVEKLGQKGEIKTVRLGYFSNFLQPKGLAKVATKAEKERQTGIAQKKSEEKLAKKKVKEEKLAKIVEKKSQAQKAIKEIVKKKK